MGDVKKSNCKIPVILGTCVKRAVGFSRHTLNVWSPEYGKWRVKLTVYYLFSGLGARRKKYHASSLGSWSTPVRNTYMQVTEAIQC